MQSVVVRAFARVLTIGVVAVGLSACVTGGQRSGVSPSGQPTSVAFESIDGAPPAVFQTLVQKLNQEAEARQVPVVTREGYAPYRIRGYVAASVVKKQTVVSWVWDVYDGETRRVARFSGEEKAGPAGRDAWNAASNEAVLAKVARSGMEQLAAYLNVSTSAPSEPAPAQAEPEDGRIVQAAKDDFQPESQGIYRLPADADTPVTTGTVASHQAASVPPRRSTGRSDPTRNDRIAAARPL